jgi:hypothetical protein
MPIGEKSFERRSESHASIKTMRALYEDALINYSIFLVYIFILVLLCISFLPLCEYFSFLKQNENQNALGGALNSLIYVKNTV